MTRHIVIKLTKNYLILSCMSCLYISDISPFSVISFADIFLPFSRLPFHFVSSLLCKSLLSLLGPNCLLLLLFPLPQDTDPKNYCYNLCQRVSCLCFLLEVLWFLILYLYMSLIHFEFIFCICCEKMFQFHSFTCSCPVFPAPLIEKTVFSISGAGKNGQLHVKNEIRTLPNTIHKNKLKMD